MEATWAWVIENRVGMFSASHGHSQGREEVNFICIAKYDT